MDQAGTAEQRNGLGGERVVCLVCYHVFGEFGEPEERQAALEQGLKEARQLQRYPNLHFAVAARWQFLQGVGRENDFFPDLHLVGEAANDPYIYMSVLYRRGEFEHAVQMLEKLKGVNVLDLIRVIPLAELPHDGVARANQLYEQIAARELREWDLFNSQLILRFLGRKREAIDVSQKFLSQQGRFPPVRQEVFLRQLEYCAGQRSEEGLINSMKGHRGDLCGSHFCVALTALADGDRDKAKKHLQLCLATHFFEFLPYDLSLMLLSRMDKDPNWPPWIQLKKPVVVPK